MRYARQALVLMSVLVILSAVAACSSNSTSNSSASTTNSVKIMMIDDESDPSATEFAFPINADAAQATAKYINANGGISGRKIDLIVCDSQADPNETTDCARQAVQDDVAAVVGSYALNSNLIPPILQAAKIPYMPSYPTGATEYTSPISFPTAAGATVLSAMGYIAGAVCKKPTLLSEQQPATAFNEKVVASAVKSQGKKLVNAIAVPANTTDYAPIAAEAMQGGADCLIVYGAQTMAGGLYPALKAAGSTQRIIGLNGQTAGSPLDAKYPQTLNNAITTDFFPPYSSPVWNGYKQAVAKYGDPQKYDYDNSAPQLVYVSMIVFENLVKSIPAGTPVTSTSVLAALHKASNVTTNGLTAPFNFTKTFPVTGFPQTFNLSATYGLVKDGQVVPLPGYTGFINVSKAFAASQGS